MTEKDKGSTILCIEDEADIRRFACRVFELEGHHCLQAENSNEAYKLLKEHKIDLVILDLRLAEADGWKILEKLKSDPKTSAIPVIVCSASFGEAQQKRALDMGAVDYLVKPLSAAVLKDAIARVLTDKR